MRQQRFAANRAGWARREVHHPQVIDVRGLEGFGGAGLQAAGAQTLAVQALAAQRAVKHTDGGQRALALLPVSVEHLERDGGILRHLFQHQAAVGPSNTRLLPWSERVAGTKASKPPFLSAYPPSSSVRTA